MAAKIHTFIKLGIIVLCGFSIMSALSNAPAEEYKTNKGLAWEEYDSSYFLKYRSVEDVMADADGQFPVAKQTSLAYFNYVAEIIRKRFYHGYSYYNLSDNPIAFIGGKFTKGHLAAIVLPNDIMKHPMAACSQQAIVLMDIFRKKGVAYRKVEFRHHYTVEAMIEGDWRYFDTDLEPNLGSKRESLTSLLRSGKFDSAYSKTGFSLAQIHQTLANPRFGKPNEQPAARASFFHKFTSVVISKYFLLVALLFMMATTIKIKRTTWSSSSKRSMAYIKH